MQDYLFLKEKIRTLDLNNEYITLENCEYVLKYALEIDDTEAQGRVYAALAFYARTKSNTQMMLENTNKLLETSEKLGDYSAAAQAMTIMGIYYYDIRQESLAIKCYFNAIKLYLKAENNYGVFCVYQNIGNMYVYLNDIEKSKYFFHRAKDYLDMAESSLSSYTYALLKLQLDISYCFYLLKANEFDKVPDMIYVIEKGCQDTNNPDFLIFSQMARAKYALGTNDNETFKSLIEDIVKNNDNKICNYEYFYDFCDCFDYSLQITDYEIAEKILSVLEEITSKDKFPSMLIKIFQRKEKLYVLTGREEEFRKQKTEYFKVLKAESSAMDSERHEFMNSKLEILKNNEKNKKSQKLLSDMETKSIYDALTGIGSRYALEIEQKNVFLEATAEEKYYSVIVIDVDHFKDYNDTFGHLAGDFCLQKVASVIKKSAEGHFVGRFGGDEFFVIARGLDPYDTKELCNVIMDNMDMMNMDFHSGVLTEITLSIGFYSAVPKDGETHFDYIDRADESLYKAKNTGRHRIIGNA